MSLRDQLRCMAKGPADQTLTSVWRRIAGRPAGRLWRRKRTLAGNRQGNFAKPRLAAGRAAPVAPDHARGRPFPILAEIIRVDLDAKMATPPPPMCRALCGDWIPTSCARATPGARGRLAKSRERPVEPVIFRAEPTARSYRATLHEGGRCNDWDFPERIYREEIGIGQAGRDHACARFPPCRAWPARQLCDAAITRARGSRRPGINSSASIVIVTRSSGSRPHRTSSSATLLTVVSITSLWGDDMPLARLPRNLGPAGAASNPAPKPAM